MAESLRAARLYDRRYTQTGLSAADADALIPHLVEFTAERRTNAECEALLNARLGAGRAEGVVGAAYVRAGGARRDRRAVVLRLPAVLPRRAVPDHAPDGREACVQQLARRYLEGFGPASAADLAQFTLLTRSAARDAWTPWPGSSSGGRGRTAACCSTCPARRFPARTPRAPPRLMAMWDSVLLAYADRSRVIPPAYRALVIRRNGDVLPTLLVDGHVAGVWRPAGGGIEATAFRELPERAWQELAEEARALVSFLAARDPAVYRRFAHWWKELPAAEVRLLPG